MFAALAILIVSLAALAMGAGPTATAKAFGDGFWSLIPFTMQMAFVVIGGYVVASSGPASRLIDLLARVPKNGRSAVCWVALVSMLASLLNWGLSLVFGGCWYAPWRAAATCAWTTAPPRRRGLPRAGRGVGAGPVVVGRAVAGQPGQPATVDPGDHRVIPFTETIFLWQSGVMLLALILVSLVIAYMTAPSAASARDAKDCGST